MFVAYENKTYYKYNIFSILCFEDFKIRHETKKFYLYLHNGRRTDRWKFPINIKMLRYL